jgi:hypothetical protein
MAAAVTSGTITFDPSFNRAACEFEALKEKVSKTSHDEKAALLGDLQRLISKTVQLCESLMLFPLICSLVNTDKVEHKIFLQMVLDKAFRRIETEPLKKRFLYEVKDGDVLTGWIIGSAHIKGVFCQDPAFLQAIQNSRRVVSELGTDTLKAPDCLDKELIRQAVTKKIPVGALETEGYQDTVLKKTTGILGMISSRDPKVWARIEHYKKDPSYFTKGICYAYFTGEEEELLHYHNGDTDSEVAIRRERNTLWLTAPITGEPNLVGQLRASSLGALKKPVTILVGVAHCLGPDGIINQLRERYHFTVVRQES